VKQRPRAVRRVLVFAGLLQLGLLVACASPPDFNEVAATTPVATPHLEGVRGPLSARQSKAILDRLRKQNPDSDVLQRHIAFEDAITDTPLTVGNKVTLLRDGEASFAAVFKAINAAKNHINLEYYTFEDVEEGGQHLVDLLVAKQAAGVQVNLIYDSIGSDETPDDVFDRLKKAGIKLLDFHPVTAPATTAKINDRDHRKILCVDGTVGIVGGVNMSKVYSSNPLASPPTQEQTTPPDYWRDTDVRIEGPAVAELESLFLDNWRRQDGGELNQANFFPPQQAADAQIVRIIGSTPDHSLPRFYVTLLSAIRNAETRIWVSAAYFVPTHQEEEDLAAAARRGVDVQLLLPSHSDSNMAMNAGRSHYTDLLEAGVKIYELQSAILHSKTAVIDGVWSAVGSSNFDGRSVLFNDEVDAIILGRETAAQLEAAFQDDFKRSDQIDPTRWRERPVGEKLQEFFSKIYSYWL
jgi:cardiolipin synthase A/B